MSAAPNRPLPQTGPAADITALCVKHSQPAPLLNSVIPGTTWLQNCSESEIIAFSTGP